MIDGQVVEWQTRGPQKAVPTGREGSSPSLVTRGPGGETEIMAPSEGAGPGSTPGRGTASDGGYGVVALHATL
jgi:hypothetical protein